MKSLTSTRALQVGSKNTPPDAPMIAAAADRFIGEAECEVLTNLSRPTRWRLERAGRFPKKRRLSPNRKGWLLSEVQAWIADRARAA